MNNIFFCHKWGDLPKIIMSDAAPSPHEWPEKLLFTQLLCIFFLLAIAASKTAK